MRLRTILCRSWTSNPRPLISEWLVNAFQSPRRHSSLLSLDELNATLGAGPHDLSIEERRKALKIEYDYLLYMGDKVPGRVSHEMWEELLLTSNSEARRRLWAVYHRRESAKQASTAERRYRARHRMDRMMKKAKEVEPDFDGNLYDEQGRNKGGPPKFLLPSINSAFVKKKYTPRIFHGILHGQNLVLDLGRPHLMDGSSEARFQRNIRSLYLENKISWDPYNLHLCNYDRQNAALGRLVEGPMSSHNLWNVTSKCFTELFPKEKIVYLTPHSPYTLKTYSHEDVYVLCATTTTGHSNHCMTYVKQMGLRSAKFGVERFFVKQDFPDFGLDKVFNVLRDLRDTDGNWLYAMRHLPGQINSRVRWLAKYRDMERFTAAEKRPTSPNYLQSEFPHEYEFNGFPERAFGNERSIFKPRTRREMNLKSFRLNDDDESDLKIGSRLRDFESLPSLNDDNDDDRRLDEELELSQRRRGS